MILNSDNKELARNELKKIIDLGIDFKCQENFAQKIVSKEDLNEILKTPLNGIELDTLIEDFKENVLPFCSNFGTTNFMGFPDAGNSVAGIAGAITADFLQQNLINSSFCAPIATYLEIAVIKWLREIIGYEISPINNIFDVGGIITYGGTGSNAAAMMLARENHRNTTMKEGVKDPSDYKVIIPKGIGHYSIRSSSMWIGCGDNIIEVPTIDFKYDLDELRKTIKQYKGKIMCVVAYVGDSRTMSIENLKAVHNIVKEEDENIWLHADACHGFSLAFSQNLRYKIQGLNLFDSISTDPHKVLMIPYTLSALLIKNPEKIKMISSTSDLIMQEPFAFGQVTPFIGSKSWVSLKAWFVMKNLGINGIGDIIEKRCKMAKYLGEKIDKSRDFILLNKVDINSVMFMYVGDKNNITNSVDELNDISKKIKEVIDKEKIYYLHQFSIPDNLGKIEKDMTIYPLRYMSGNDNIEENNIDKMLDYVRKVAKRVIEGGEDENNLGYN
ncbi:MAG: pyridoxal-dependent decarboxylase [Clostridiales bacterium]|nr:pyridoxal-dependent decarboxylase [Clostridiales bacterium]